MARRAAAKAIPRVDKAEKAKETAPAMTAGDIDQLVSERVEAQMKAIMEKLGKSAGGKKSSGGKKQATPTKSPKTLDPNWKRVVP